MNWRDTQPSQRKLFTLHYCNLIVVHCNTYSTHTNVIGCKKQQTNENSKKEEDTHITRRWNNVQILISVLLKRDEIPDMSEWLFRLEWENCVNVWSQIDRRWTLISHAMVKYSSSSLLHRLSYHLFYFGIERSHRTTIETGRQLHTVHRPM